MAIWYTQKKHNPKVFKAIPEIISKIMLNPSQLTFHLLKVNNRCTKKGV